ncbi:MAG: hypothetical protein V9F04_14890 [Dermatophilaceae bacterium]
MKRKNSASGPTPICVAELGRLRDDLLERDARVARERRAVGVGDVADEAGDGARGAVAPRQDREGVRIGAEVHVRLLDPLVAADRRAVEHELVVQRLLELLDRDRDVLHVPVELGELEPHEAHVVLAALLDQVALVHAVLLVLRPPREGARLPGRGRRIASCQQHCQRATA